MRLFFPKENHPAETRAAAVPASVAKLVKLGAEVEVESGFGAGVHFSDDDFSHAGATLATDRAAALAGADVVLRLRQPPAGEIARLKRGCIHVSYLDPFNELALVRQLAEAGVSAIAMELIPRSTLAQKMDANGYPCDEVDWPTLAISWDPSA